jgi:hypothetical protein
MLYLNQLIVKANGTQRSDAEIIAHDINVAPRVYNIPLSIISQNDINASDALNRAQTELRNYWRRNIERIQGRQSRYQTKTESAFAFTGGKQQFIQGTTKKGYDGDRKNTKDKSWKKFKGNCTYCGMQGHKAANCGLRNNNSLE